MVFAAFLALLGLLYPGAEGYLTVVLRGFAALGFFAAGFFGSRWWQRNQKLMVMVIAATAYLVLAEINGLVNMVSCTFHHPILYVANALLGTFVLLQLSLALSRRGNGGKLLSLRRSAWSITSCSIVSFPGWDISRVCCSRY